MFSRPKMYPRLGETVCILTMHAFRRCLSVRTAYSLCSLMTSRPSVNIVSSRFFRITVSPYLMDRTKPATQILQNLTPEDSTRLDCIKSEHAIFIASGKAVPLKLSDEEYLELLCCPSLSARNRYYLFRFKIHKKKEAKELKRSAKNTEEPVTELVQKNQILRMIRSSPIRCHRDDWLAAELRTADTSAQTLVIDCSHEEEMRQVDQRNLAKQISMVYSQNRAIRTFPFHLMLTSLVPKTNQYHFFEQTFCVGESVSSTLEITYSFFNEHFSINRRAWRRIPGRYVRSTSRKSRLIGELCISVPMPLVRLNMENSITMLSTLLVASSIRPSDDPSLMREPDVQVSNPFVHLICIHVRQIIRVIFVVKFASLECFIRNLRETSN